jgi:hypothetical protein
LAYLADGQGEVAVIRMFVDESGVHDDSPCVSVAGYVSRPLKWRKFTRHWKQVLRPSKIEIFHATDCAGLHGEFKGWTVEKRDKLVTQLLPIIPQYAFGYTVALKLSEVEKALETRPELREFHRDPYASCFMWMLLSFLTDLDERTTGEARPIAVVHEVNDFKKSATDAFDYVRDTHPLGHLLLSLTFGTKQKFVPLQAADTLAYEAARRIRFQDGPERRSLTALNTGERISFKSFNRNNIHGYVEMLEKLKEAYEAR